MDGWDSSGKRGRGGSGEKAKRRFWGECADGGNGGKIAEGNCPNSPNPRRRYDPHLYVLILIWNVLKGRAGTAGMVAGMPHGVDTVESRKNRYGRSVAPGNGTTLLGR